MALSSTTTVGFIGAGNMAEALVRGLIAAKVLDSRQIYLADVRAERLEQLAGELAVHTCPDNLHLLGQVDIVVLAVKPQGLGDLLREIGAHARPRHLFISILAGTRTERIEAGLAHEDCPSPRVVRAMPNTPALVGAGATGLAPGAHATDDDLKTARALFEACGVAEIVAPGDMDAITGLTGSGPAYIFRVIEALLEAARAQGLDAAAADRLVKQMVYGAALMARDSEFPPDELRRRVTSPNGTTAAGLAVLEAEGFGPALVNTVDAATKRSVELSQA